MTEKSVPPEERDAVSSGSAKGTNGSEGGDLAFCLLKISQIHGLFVSLERILSGLPLENDILVPSCFERAAAKAGMTSRITRAPLGKLNTALLPLVLVLSENRACVLLSMDRQNGVARVLFPELGDGETTIELSRLETLYSGYAFYVKPLFRFDERAPSYNRKRSSSWFWSSISENRPIYRDVITASAISNVFALAMPLFTMNIYNRIIPNRAMDSLWVTAAGVLIMVSADFLLHMARTHLVDKAAARTNTRLSAIMMEQVLALKTADRPSSVGSFANVIQGFESVRNFISSATLFAYVDIPFSLFFLLIISLIAWPLAIPLAVGSVLILLHAALIQGTMRDLAETTNRASALKNATLIESLVGMETVKSQGAESHVQKRWETSVSFLEHVNTRLRLLSGSVITGTQWVQQTVSVVTMLVGVYLVVNNSLSMGALIAVYMLSSRCIAPVGRAAGLLMQYNTASRSLAALDDIMRKEPERPSEGTFLSRPRLKGDVEFSGVTFTYPGQERPALSGVSFRIAHGERVALVGRIGSGKSTVGKLLLGLYQPQSGTVFIDGADIRQIDPGGLRRNVGSAGRDPLFRHVEGKPDVREPSEERLGNFRSRRRHGSGPLRQPASPWLRHAGRRTGRVSLLRAEAGNRRIQGPAETGPHPHARRTDRVHGQFERGTRPPEPRLVHRGQDADFGHPQDRASGARRPHHRAGRGKGHRGRAEGTGFGAALSFKSEDRRRRMRWFAPSKKKDSGVSDASWNTWRDAERA